MVVLGGGGEVLGGGGEEVLGDGGAGTIVFLLFHLWLQPVTPHRSTLQPSPPPPSSLPPSSPSPPPLPWDPAVLD